MSKPEQRHNLWIITEELNQAICYGSEDEMVAVAEALNCSGQFSAMVLPDRDEP
jgi:hypothetical protein